MDSKQHLYYALGILAYAVAKADGTVQKEEREIIHKIVSEEIDHAVDFDYTEIIFQILQKDQKSFNQVYEWAMESFRTGKHHFSPEMKASFITVVKRVADAFPPTTKEEQKIITRFEEDVEALETPLLLD